MNELAWRHHFPILSLWEIFRRSRAANFLVSSPIWPKFELVRDFMHVLVTCKYKKDRIKSNGEKVATYKSIGTFCCHGHQSFDPICLKTLCSLSPAPVMLHIKFDKDWPAGLRNIQVRKCKIFVIQGQVTPKWVVWSGPKPNSSELLMPVLVTSNFDDDSIKNERASMETPFSHYKSMGNFLDAQGS